MTTRITGMASGLDVDELVKAELSSYKEKIKKQNQNKEVLKIQQEMYQDVISKGSEFYTKYLDRTQNGNLISSSAYAINTFSSTNESAVTAKAAGGSAIKDNYQVKVTQLAKPASKIVDLASLTSAGNTSITVKVGDKNATVDLSSILNSDKSAADKNADLVTALNNNLSSLGLKAVNSQISGGIILRTTDEGEAQSFSIEAGDGNKLIEAKGQDCKYTISSSTSGGEREFTSATNSATLDGITFSFTSVTSEPVTITGKTDASDVVDKIVSFFNDYNSMLTNFQKLLKEKHDRNYAPLSDEEKAEMKDNQIEKWEEKVKTGQLHNDSLVQDFVSAMRGALSSSTSELKKIGITTNSEYGVKAGTITVDEKKLKAALEADADSVMKLFIATEETKTDADGKSEKNESTGGVFTKMKNVLYNNTVSTTKSSLIKKAGTALSNANSTITKQLTTMAKKISQMQSSYTSKETKLYSKYSKLETAMNSYNNQLSSIQSFFS